jgi:pyruvate,water dikinase
MMDALTLDALVLPLHSPQASLATAGGKGANLSQLVQAGFLVSTAAYRTFVQDNDLQQQIVARARSGAATDFEAVSAAIRQLFERASMPSQVATAIQQAYAALGMEGQAPIPLAVRSSATAEDLPGASFADQQETFLNVRGEQDVLQAVKRCWSSLWTPRALAYRARQDIDPATVSLAVVVQALVQADAAGVLFTANPLSGVRDEIVIDAAWGLGEAVVSGLVTPDHLIADEATGTIKQVAVAEKTVMTAPTPSGTEERAVETDRRHVQVLDAAQVAQLVRLGSAIEAHYHTPQDIEWCLAGDQFWIVQSRPITTRERHKRLAPPPFVPLLSDPTWGSDRMWKLFSSAKGEMVLMRGAQEHNGRRVLVGTPGSPGRARGTARVIAGPDDFHRFQPGDVLVAHATTPIWTPLFNIASAVVTEVGGTMSHAAIVTREFGIPLVNGALDATQVIVDGMSVVVDGSAGIVEL